MAKKPFYKKKKKKTKTNESDFESVPQNVPQNESKKNWDEEMDDEELSHMISDEKKKKCKSGGFQSMGLSPGVLRGVLRKGYRVPTPIQRKCMPLIVDGKDVVGMARTGSGKTAAFLVPLLERLKTHSAKTGARGLILSPTRELCLQTLKFTKELSRFTDIKYCAIVGGDSMEKQFAAIHENPDIVICTPGRFLHVIVEMNLKLDTIEYVVFDEADRLFEMGFKEQLNEIVSRLPDNRQTLLFSATLPQSIVDFTKAGLNDPQLVRLDTETKLSENLRNVFLTCRNEDKFAILLHLLKCVINRNEMTLVFVATRHHVEYIKDILMASDIHCSYLYSSLDQEARKLNVSHFQSKKVKLLVVTDVAARGVDIPMLDNVINFNFPAKSKLFVHRVGRVARAGRTGVSYSLISPDEAPFLHSLHLFLNREIKFSNTKMNNNEEGVIGSVPQNIIDEENELLNHWHSASIDLQNMKRVCSNAYKQYLKSRPSPAQESVKIMKEMTSKSIDYHPIFTKNNDDSFRNNLLNSIKLYRPTSTIFETGKTKNSTAFEVMQNKRKTFEKIVKRASLKEEASNEIKDNRFKDEEYFLEYRSNQHHSEKGLELEKPFNAEMAAAVFDVAGDETESLMKSKNSLKWDRKKKRFIGRGETDQNKKKIKTESGNWISASYKTDLYKKWKEKSKAEQQDSDEEINEEAVKRDKSLNMRRKQKGNKRPPRRELKNPEEILKERKRQEKIKSFQKWRKSEKAKKKGAKGHQNKRR